MAAKKTNKRKTLIKRKPIKTDCVFCNTKTEPDYKDSKTLERFLSDRAKILGRDRTGLCTKHHKRIPKQVKRARHLALLPFSQTV